MNKRNLMIVGLMMCSSLFGEDISPTWLKAYEKKDRAVLHGATFKYSGSKNMTVFNKWYSQKKLAKITGGNLKEKIVITQKIPCYVAPKKWGMVNDFHGGLMQGKIEYSKKVNPNTIEIYKMSNSNTGQTMFTKSHRLISYDDAKGKNVVNLLGSSIECLKQPNEETWTVYWYLKDEWVAMAREKFYLKP